MADPVFTDATLAALVDQLSAYFVRKSTLATYQGLPVTQNPDGTVSWNGQKFARDSDIPSHPLPATTTPPPPVVQPPAPAVSDRWSAAPSQWAKWNFVTAGEQLKLFDLYGQTPVLQHINHYQSYYRLNGQMRADGYYFVDSVNMFGLANWVKDVNGAADAKHRTIAGANEIAPLG